MSEVAPVRRGNRLAREKSPYLRQHAHNPVDWFPWGDEAFAKAVAQQKPIFLSVGYSTCHWCHVMAHESFENGAIAQALNRDFVPVKVDREERPDVDRVYMTYVQTATGQGGWPMSVWLTPALKPFYGGTYFPREDQPSRPGFATVLAVLAQAWADQREQLLVEGDRVAEALRGIAGTGNPAGSTNGDLVTAAGHARSQSLQELVDSYDDANGGFGGAPKFPRPAVFSFLFRSTGAPAGKTGNWKPDAGETGIFSGIPGSPSGNAGVGVKMAAETLRKMAAGGIHDHVGGGFHRYSVDANWFVPHFEKMLYDQAQLAVSYLEARQSTGHEDHAWVARGIFDYVLRDLAHPAGGFYSAEDADSEMPESGERGPERQSAENDVEALDGSRADAGNPVRSQVSGIRDRERAEGAFYLWTKEEIGRALEDGTGMSSLRTGATRAAGPQIDAEIFCAHFDVQPAGNVSAARDPRGEFSGRNILRQRQSLAQTAQQFGIEPATAGDRLQTALDRLRKVRDGRPRPHLDDKIVTAWNGLMISALAKGHQVLRRVDYLEAAVRAAEFVRRELYDEQGWLLYRSWCNGRGNAPGFAEDYAYFVQGLLDLYEASFDIRWLKWAAQLQAAMDERFWDAEHGGYFNSRAEDLSIIARLKENYDGAEPAPSSVAALNLLRMEVMIGNDADPDSLGLGKADRARQCLEAFRGQWTAAPHSLPQMLCALACIQSPMRTIVIAGDPAGDDFRALVAVTHERIGPRQVLLAADQGEGQAWLAVRRPYLAEMKAIDGRATAYVCENFTCRQPVTDPAELRRIAWGGP
jgi:hypothetical protein